MGEISVATDRYWGAQTAALPAPFRYRRRDDAAPLIRAFGILKGASATVNRELGKLDDRPGRP